MNNARRNVHLAGWMVCAAVLASAAGALAFPEPSIVPKSWELDIKLGKPQAVAIRDLNGDPQWFWYLSYVVTNNTGEERLFIPEVTVASDMGDILSAGQNVPPGVFTAIKQREKNSLLMSPVEIVGRLLQGPDFAKESAIIWPAFKHPVDEVSIFIAGISGESQSVPHPGTGESIVMRKTLMLRYATPGGNVHPQSQSVKFEGDEWVMR